MVALCGLLTLLLAPSAPASAENKYALISGEVTEQADGSGVPGVVVDLFAATPGGERGTWIGQTRTGDDGSYEFEVTGGCVVMTFIAPTGRQFTNGSQWLNIPTCVMGGDVSTGHDAQLKEQDNGREPAAVGGTISYGDAQPGVGVQVDLFEANADGSRGPWLDSTNTDDNGDFLFPGLDPGCYVVTFIAPSGETFTNGSMWLNRVGCPGPGETTNLNATLSGPNPPGPVTNAVDDDIDATAGTPIGNIDVTANDTLSANLDRVDTVANNCSGLTLSTNGTLSGTPDTAGTCTLTYRLVSTSGSSDTGTITVTTQPPAAVTNAVDDDIDATAGTPIGNIDVTANDTLSANLDRVDTVANNCSGLTLSTNGTLSGTPDTAGTCTLTYRLVSTSGSSDTGTITVTTQPGHRRFCDTDAPGSNTRVVGYKLTWRHGDPVFHTQNHGPLMHRGSYPSSLLTSGEVTSISDLQPVDSSFEADTYVTKAVVRGDSFQLILSTPSPYDILVHMWRLGYGGYDPATLPGYLAQQNAKRASATDYPDVWTGTYTAIENGQEITNTFEVCLSAYFEQRTFNVTPIAFDLNGDGEIGVTGETTARDAERSSMGRTVEFDIDADGTLDTIEWFAGDGDGILVDNRDGRALTDMAGHRLFGDDAGTYSNGYEKLSELDLNGDRVLTGAEIEGLALWIDDGDAVAEEGELVAADDYGVTRIDTNMVLTADGLMRSSATINGKLVMTEDVWFQTDGFGAAEPGRDTRTGLLASSTLALAGLVLLQPGRRDRANAEPADAERADAERADGDLVDAGTVLTR